MPGKFSLFTISTFLFGSLWAVPQQQDDRRPAPPSAQESQSQSQESPEREDFYLLLTGSVLLDDGSPAPVSLRVEMVCNERVLQQTFIDVQGHFAFELGSRTSFKLRDASVSGGHDLRAISRGESPLWVGNSRVGTFDQPTLGRVKLSGCEVRVPKSSGFFSDPIMLSSRSMFDDSDIGAIVLRRLSRSDASTVTVATLTAPVEARTAYEKAKYQLSRKKVDYSKVTEELERAVDLFPKFALAWHELGQTRLALNDREGARQAFEQAITSDPKFFVSYLGLARMELEQQRWDRAAELTSRLVELHPQYPQGRYFHGLANYYLNRFDAAKASFLTMEENEGSRDYPMAHYYLAMIYIEEGEIPSAAAEFRLYLANSLEGYIPEDLKERISRQLQIWEAQGLTEKEPIAGPPSSEEP
ncbi:tetratricopeptide repeat protein [Acidobacteria bacterium AH-259-O06]|nr:tetratricopeptide repeat protein [Acidobacteria bacterium AH-259-O06]